jgi:regulator of sigma E protease
MHLAHIVVLFALVLGFMVLIHELGHFIMAKLCGVRVETFSLGFGPRLFGVKVGDTDYRVSALPLGGYVKMAGDNDNPAERRLDESIDLHGSDHPMRGDEFNARPRWQRILIALAGPFANFILSFTLMAMIAHYHYEVPEYLTRAAVTDYVPVNSLPAKAGLVAGDTIVKFGTDQNPDWKLILNDCMLNLNRDVPFTFSHNGELKSGIVHITPSDNNALTADPLDLAAMGLIPRESPGPIGVTAVQGSTPAERAGLQAGDLIESIDTLQPHSVPALLAYLRDRNGAPELIHVQRNGQALTLAAQPEKIETPGAPTQYRLGFEYRPPPTAVQRLPWGASLAQSYQDNKKDSTLVGRILKGMFTRHVAVKSLSGPVGIAQQIDLAAQYGIWVLFGFMSTISLQLGIFNLLPIPLLDGGMILFLLIESITRRDVNQQIKERVYQVAFVCLIVFFAFVMFNDITKLHLGHS